MCLKCDFWGKTKPKPLFKKPIIQEKYKKKLKLKTYKFILIYKIILGVKNKAKLGHLGTSIYSTSLENDFSIKQNSLIHLSLKTILKQTKKLKFIKTF